MPDCPSARHHGRRDSPSRHRLPHVPRGARLPPLYPRKLLLRRLPPRKRPGELPRPRSPRCRGVWPRSPGRLARNARGGSNRRLSSRAQKVQNEPAPSRAPRLPPGASAGGQSSLGGRSLAGRSCGAVCVDGGLGLSSTPPRRLTPPHRARPLPRLRSAPCRDIPRPHARPRPTPASRAGAPLGCCPLPRSPGPHLPPPRQQPPCLGASPGAQGPRAGAARGLMPAAARTGPPAATAPHPCHPRRQRPRPLGHLSPHEARRCTNGAPQHLQLPPRAQVWKAAARHKPMVASAPMAPQVPARADASAPPPPLHAPPAAPRGAPSLPVGLVC